MIKAALSIVDLSVVLRQNGRDNLVLDRINLEAMPGEIIAVVGESGSGKSTLGTAIQGLLPAFSEPKVTGSIRLAGTEIVGARPAVLCAARHQLVRTIPQDPMGALNPTMTIRHQLRESAGGDDTFIRDWLDRVGLADADAILDAFPHRLSGGQRQRILIAMALMARPKVLIADEVITALDFALQDQVLELLREGAREHQMAVLFITHNLAAAASLADRIFVLYRGRVVEFGRTDDALTNPRHPYLAGLLATQFDFETDRRRLLPTLPVEQTQFANPENACCYAARCPVMRGECITGRPELHSLAIPSHAAACIFPELADSAARRYRTTEIWPPAPAAGPVEALRLSSVSKSFTTTVGLFGRRRERQVLESVDLSVRLGQCVALVGESGAGKSTILRLAAGLLAPDGGEIFRIDVSPQVIFQDAVASLTPWLPIGQQIGDRLRHLGLGKVERVHRVREAFELVGLDKGLMSSLPSSLSVGQCQRAVIARAIVLPPKLLLCDEPISALDVSLAATTLNLLGRLRRQLGMAVLFITHDLAAARIIADRIAVLDQGRVVQQGDPDATTAGFGPLSMSAILAAIPKTPASTGGRDA
ncbi:peptide/nickel transport system ATP-binding protein [Rhizobium sp. BK529]|uniref:oligopeptide/dipeptide ABC transporter ATP-binding protein n=1 Tax=unclassified Rhizobium TaxID=2613769 RepID=UPI00104EA509|nr:MULTISPECIES: ABC transporter ATP-binding protein [unclassified Rhizobium]MBB3594248.1 peptide/nickel transport system ATP-binding protein [Rhizobium sp. BK529]TCS01704.1 peptide/nickel transport system ATP-binding protein [Rhizobium sp. BK418]